MTTTAPTSTVSASIIAASRDDMDLVAADRRRDEQALFYGHCKRVWCKLSPEERLAVRQQVVADDPDLAQRHPSLMDWECYDAVGAIVRQHGHFLQTATND